MKPKVSICVPIYGVEKYIERCARSLFEQTYENIEYIFIDDCTPDKSIEILKNVLDDYPLRKEVVRIIQHDHNRGLAGARNTAVANATGQFLMHVDSDDYISTNTVEKLVETQMKDNADIVSCDYYCVYPNNKIIKNEKEAINGKDYAFGVLLGKYGHHIWGRLIRTDLYRENSIQALEGANMGEDFQVVPQLYYYSKKIASCHIPLYFYSMLNENSYTNNATQKRMMQSIASKDYVYGFYRSLPEDTTFWLRINELYYAVSFLKYYALADNADFYYDKALDFITTDNLKELSKLSVMDRIIIKTARYKKASKYILRGLLRLRHYNE